MAMSSGAGVRGVPFWLAPIGWTGRGVVGVLGYLGGLARLLLSAATAPIRPAREEAGPGVWAVLRAELSWLLLMGFPLVGLVHVGMGSFLSLQAYFGSTFVDGTGAVVGVGLLRNLASLMTGMSLSGLLAGRIIPDLLGRPAGAHAPDADRGRAAAPRMAAAAVASVLLALWGSAVGTLVGWQAAGQLISLPTSMFFLMFSQMLWFRDVIGMIVKGIVFGLLPAAICCHEGLRGRGEAPGPGRGLDGRIVRAACLSITAILLVNMAWFLLVYHAVPVYGPSLLAPPTP